MGGVVELSLAGLPCLGRVSLDDQAIALFRQQPGDLDLEFKALVNGLPGYIAAGPFLAINVNALI